MDNKKEFTKKATSPLDQINILQKRGLSIENRARSEHCLKTVSFHRLSAYFKPFELEQSNHQFKPNTKFEHLWDLYLFDRELRLWVLDAIEKIEIALRTSLSNIMSLKYGPWWFLENEVFKSEWIVKKENKNTSPSDEFNSELSTTCNKKNPEEGIKHYYNNYNHPTYPPSWIVLECLSFGRCTNLFRYIRNHKDKAEICSVFSLHHKIFESFLEPLRYTRNLCAHHARLWNRWFVYKPKGINELKQIGCIPGTLKEQLAILLILIKKISPESNWKNVLFGLFEKYDSVPLPFKLTGFHENWKLDDFWKL